jgi:hypothetical protein
MKLSRLPLVSVIRRSRARIGAVAAVVAIAAVSTVGASPAPASAQTKPAYHAGNGTMRVAPAVRGEPTLLPSRTSEASVAASPPTTSPVVENWWYDSRGGFPQCPYHYACAHVPWYSGFYFFKFYYYGTYKLYNWYGWGWASNNQSGFAAMRLLDVNRHQVTCLVPALWSVNWDPIWYIRLTSSPC